MKKISIILMVAIFALCLGCKGNAVAGDKLEQQEQRINEMSSQIKKIEMQSAQLQKEMDELKKQFGKVKDDIKKVQPHYVEGGMQEGGN